VNLGWTLRRLRAMSAAEIIMRLRRRLRDHLVPPLRSKLSAEQAFDTYFRGENPLASWGEVPDGVISLLQGPPPALEPVSLDAALRLDLFGKQVVLDDPPNWHKNYATGAEWPIGEKMDFHRTDLAGGPKWVWEINRHSMFSALAYGYHATGDLAYAGKLLAWMEDWVDRNPADRGIHWTSALELAVRLVVWTWCLRMVAASPEGRGLLARSPMKKIVGCMAQHADYVCNNYSYGSSGNNHLIGEVAALAVFARCWPAWDSADQWLVWARAMAEHECLNQFWPDGVSKEQSFHYVPFIWEFYLHMALAGIPLSPEVIARLDASARFVDAIATCSGFVPQVGDEDDGTVLRQLPGGWPRFGVIGSALATELGIRLARRPIAGHPEDAVLVFPEGGYTVFRTRSPEIHVLFDHGPLGFGSLAAHGHADALSVAVSLDGRPLLVDPGAYTYHDEPAWRDYFRSTRAHNTVCIDGRSQAEMLGPFLWGRRYEVRATAGSAHTYHVPGRTTPFYDATHERSVRLEGRRLVVTDRIMGGFRSAEAAWHCHPDVEVSRNGERELVLAQDGKRVARMSLHFAPADLSLVRGNPADDKPTPGWYSPGLGRKTPTTSILVRLPSRAEQLVTHFDFD